MAYRLPDFNLLASLWLCNNTPGDVGPDYDNFACQKYIYSKHSPGAGFPPWFDEWHRYGHFNILLRFPRITPFEFEWYSWNVGIVECPRLTGQYYRQFGSEIMHQGFPNEYACLMCSQCDASGRYILPAGSAIQTGTVGNACGDTPP